MRGNKKMNKGIIIWLNGVSSSGKTGNIKGRE